MQRDNILLLWSGFKNLPDILYLINAWGYKYVNVLFVWVKMNKSNAPKLGMGFWSRNNVEVVVLATKGRTSVFRNEN